MNIKVKVEGRVFTVEVGDLYTRPIKVLVDGEPFDVWVEESEAIAATPARPESSNTTADRPAPVAVPAPSSTASSSKIMRAPIPGVIDSIAVVAGETVAKGQELCVIEAMKMKNVIRAARAGKITTVSISKGQHVRHNDVLMEFAD